MCTISLSDEQLLLHTGISIQIDCVRREPCINRQIEIGSENNNEIEVNENNANLQQLEDEDDDKREGNIEQSGLDESVQKHRSDYKMVSAVEPQQQGIRYIINKYPVLRSFQLYSIEQRWKFTEFSRIIKKSEKFGRMECCR